MSDTLQDEGLVKFELAELERMKQERAPWESHYRECEARVNPIAAGGFGAESPGNRRGQRNFDVTAIEGLKRFAAAMCDITVPQAQQYISIRFADNALDKLPEVRRWCAYAGERLYAIRYAAHTMFQTHVSADFLALGTYGTAPMWTSSMPGRGLWYKALPLAECFIDEDYAGLTDTVRRSFSWSARQCEQFFGRDNLTPRMRKALDDDKPGEKFELLHAIRPSSEIKAGAFDWRGKPIGSTYIAQDEKQILRRGGFNSMPITVSRHVTSPGEKYGRSPAMDLLPAINTANAMGQTNLRAANKAVDPALAFYSEDGLTSLVTRPGGANSGLMSDEGQLRVARIPGGEQGLPFALEMQERERAIIDAGFLGQYFKLLTDTTVQRSATAVLEIAGKTGVLVAPYGSRYEAEKEGPITQRELELALEAGQMKPPPPVVQEARAWPRVEYLNPLRRMAQSQEAAGVTRLIEILTPMEQSEPGTIGDVLNIDVAGPGVASALGIRADWTRTQDEIAARRAQRAQAKQEAASIEALATAAGATKDFAQAGQISQAAQ